MGRILNKSDLRTIYDRTRGKCHLCHRKLAFNNYGCVGARMAWEIEHSNPRANGGTERFNNLYGACIPCNRSKGARSTRSARGKNGYTRAPLSREKHAAAKRGNTLGGAVAGGLLGFRVGGPPGAALGALLGAAIGSSKDPDD
jgi:5-methylcytosine-specific restriction endonuclease McrA